MHTIECWCFTSWEGTIDSYYLYGHFVQSPLQLDTHMLSKRPSHLAVKSVLGEHPAAWIMNMYPNSGGAFTLLVVPSAFGLGFCKSYLFTSCFAF